MSLLNDPIGTVRRHAQTGTILIRSLNRLGHPGWTAIYFEPDADPKQVYFYYELGGWDNEEYFPLLTEWVVGAPGGR